MDEAVDLNSECVLWTVLNRFNWKEENYGIFSTVSLAKALEDELQKKGDVWLTIVEVISQEALRVFSEKMKAERMESSQVWNS